MLICIDAGHGRRTPGKRCLKSIDPGETREWVLNSRVADKLQALLANYDCKTMRADDVTGETDVPRMDRCRKANSAKADVFISIHHNAGIKGGSGGGIVVYTSIKCSTMSSRLQDAAYRHLIRTTGLRGNRSDPKPKKDWDVVRYTDMPAILCECGYMDSAHDTPIILTDDFAQKAAQGLCDALVEVFHLCGKKPVNIDMDWPIPAQEFTLDLVDKGKRDCGPGDYCNASYFGVWDHGLTLPVGHLKALLTAADQDTVHYCHERGTVRDGRLAFDSGAWSYANPMCGKALSTLVVKGNVASICECVHLPADCDYAVSGIPVIRNGVACTWEMAKAQGWDYSSCRATWHRFAALKGDGVVHMLRIETHTDNFLVRRELAALAAMGYRDVIKLDGGGSDYSCVNGKQAGTAGNRRICSVVRRVKPTPPEKPKPPVDKLPLMPELWAKAQKLGITDGSRPRDPASREEVAAMILNAIERGKLKGD